MTDITDQDRRDARQWAEAIGSSDASVPDHLWHAASRVILATVDAPATTLAEELRGQSEWARRIGAPCNAEKIDSFAARAEQMEHDLEEARAKVERLNREQGRLDAQVQGLTRLDGDRNSEVRMLAEERNEALIEVERLTDERDEAYKARDAMLDEVDRLRAEVERLTDERDAETVAPGENVAPDQQANTQEILEGSLPNPADVKPREPWLIRVVGREALAVRDGDTAWPWSAALLDGGIDDVSDESVTLVTRLVPAPRVITNPDELDKLATRAVILSTDGQADVYQHHRDGWVDITGTQMDSRSVIRVERAVTVLWEPGA